MATAARGWQAFTVFLEMVKIEHSIFALPFALIGMMWGSMQKFNTPWPGFWIFGWIVVAMVSCRSAAMAYNRISDREIDSKNPRTQMRAIPAGLLTLRTANLYFFGFCILFFISAFMLNWLAFALSPVALGVTVIYSKTKLFTPLCHYVLGLSLGIAPAAAWIAASGALHPAILPLVAAVMLWTAGFDIIYSLQDEEFDKENSLKSIPATIGKRNALMVSRISHILAIGFLAVAAYLNHAGLPTYLGVGFCAALLAYEQSLVKPDDLSKVNLAFFTLNGFVSLGMFGFVLVDQFT